MKKFNRKKNNMGFSLVELIVSLLISSIVIATIVFFVATGLSSYQKASTETTLQMEAQTASNQITDLLLEAKTYSYFSEPDILGNIQQILVIVIDSEGKEYYYVIATNEKVKKILLCKTEKTEEMTYDLKSEADKIIEENDMFSSANKYLLANHVTSMTVEPSKPFDDITLNQLVHIIIELELHGKNFTTTNSVTMRNGLQ